MDKKSIANLRLCASCEWIFEYKEHEMCPKCGFGSYGAHWVYGKKAYKYKKTQEPWMKNKIEKYNDQLIKEINNGGE